MKKRYIIGAICASLVLLSLMAFVKKGSVNYTTKAITKATITQTVEASGTIKPINTIAVGTQVSGTVQKIYVDYNSISLCGCAGIGRQASLRCLCPQGVRVRVPLAAPI